MIKVGIVEDNNTLRKSLTSLFTEAKDMRCVMSLNNLLHIVKEIQKNSPDVILMDMWLSGEDGRDICRTIRGDENLCDIPVLIMSASRGLEQSALDAGANDFIAKPFDMVDMITRVRTYIKEI